MGPQRELRPGDRGRVWDPGEREAPSSLSKNPLMTAGAGLAGTARQEGCLGERVAGDGGKWRFRVFGKQKYKSKGLTGCHG